MRRKWMYISCFFLIGVGCMIGFFCCTHKGKAWMMDAKRVRITRSDLIMVGCWIWVSCCADNEKVREIEAKLEIMPAWANLRRGDQQAKEKIMAAMEELSQYRLCDIGEVMFRCTSDDVGYWSKLFILNKYLFAVPERVPRGSMRYFGGWVRPEISEKEVNLMWPLSYKPDGTLALTGDFSGYYGSGYMAFENFCCYWWEFGRRPSPSAGMSE